MNIPTSEDLKNQINEEKALFIENTKNEFVNYIALNVKDIMSDESPDSYVISLRTEYMEHFVSHIDEPYFNLVLTNLNCSLIILDLAYFSKTYLLMTNNNPSKSDLFQLSKDEFINQSEYHIFLFYVFVFVGLIFFAIALLVLMQSTSLINTYTIIFSCFVSFSVSLILILLIHNKNNSIIKDAKIYKNRNIITVSDK